MKYSHYKLLFLTVVMLMASCQSTVESGEKEKEQVAEIKTPFERSLAYHGGLDQWNKMGQLSFVRINNNDSTLHIIDLKNRNERIQTGNGYLGFNNNGIWTNSQDEKVRGNVARFRFQKNLWFYFFSLPFVTADPGANQETIADGVSNGKNYDRIKITFGEGVGDAPDDQYILWLDKETGRLEMINYSVTFGRGKEASEKYNAIVYSEWQTVNGLQVPKKVTPHVWAGDSLGAPRADYYFANVNFKEQRPDESVFATPEGAAFTAY